MKLREKRRALGRYSKLASPIKVERPDDGIPTINIIVKGDVAGSVEAILDVFNTYGSDDKCRLSIVHYGVGPVTETDLQIADAFGGKNISHEESIDIISSISLNITHVKSL